TVTQHEVGGGEHRGSDGEDGLLGPAAGAKAEELGLQVALLYPDAGPRGGDEGGFEPGAALADPGRSMLTGTLVVAWTQARPGDQVTAGREASHVDADLR